MSAVAVGIMEQNTVGAIVGRNRLQWGAIWYLFEWFCNPDEGHGLGRTFLDNLSTIAFGEPLYGGAIKREFQLIPNADGKGKWPDLVIGYPSLDEPEAVIVMDDVDRRSPGDSRKINNLFDYRALALDRFPKSRISVVVLTNATDATRMTKLANRLGPQRVAEGPIPGWQLLPLSDTASWVETSSSREPTTSIDYLLLNYEQWARSFKA